MRKTLPTFVVMLLMGVALTACQPGTETVGAEQASRFAVSTVEVGVRYDEPVVITGSATAAEPSHAASVVLQRRAHDGSFHNTLGAADSSGNESETDIMVIVRSESTGD